MPKLRDGGDGAFIGCTSLEIIVLQGCSGSYHTFEGCSSLQKVDYGGLDTTNHVNTRTFYNCPKLNTLIIRRKTGNSNLTGLDVFNGTPFASGGTGGTLYVPQDLISSYQTATNWSTILSYENNQILSIEGSIYETQYADGTPVGGAS